MPQSSSSKDVGILSMIQYERCPEKLEATANGKLGIMITGNKPHYEILDSNKMKYKLDPRSPCLRRPCLRHFVRTGYWILNIKATLTNSFLFSLTSNNGSVLDATLSRAYCNRRPRHHFIVSHLQAFSPSGRALRPTATAKIEIGGRRSGSLWGGKDTRWRQHLWKSTSNCHFISSFGILFADSVVHFAPKVFSPSLWKQDSHLQNGRRGVSHILGTIPFFRRIEGSWIRNISGALP